MVSVGSNFLPCAVLLITLLAAGCATQSKQESSPSFRALGQSVDGPRTDDARSDEDIGQDVRRQLNLGAPGDAAAIIVEVSEGVVTLSGSASSFAAAWRAAAAAHAVRGVKDVANRILVESR
jgi:osmotically-inducible protein OsmY